MAVTETRTLPAKFVEDLGTDLAKQLVAQTAVPVVSTGVAGISQQPGETAGQFAARQKAAQQFQIRQQSLSGLAPQIAGQDPLQQQAQTLATQGIGSYQPFLQAAQQQATAAGQTVGDVGTTLSGIAGLTGAPTSAQIQQYMSPYQSQVIDTTLSEFDRQKAIQEKSIADQAIAAGAFGGGREGVQRAEFQTGAARERALLQAGLLQQGFGQAQQARQQDIQTRFGLGQAQSGLAGQQLGLGQFQSGLAQLLPGLQGTDISRLGSLGSLNQAQEQARLDAQREAARQAVYLPQEQLQQYTGAVTGIMGGYPAAFQSSNVPNPTPLQTALGFGATAAGIYGGLGGRFFN
jgi:hypothetical protein